VSSSDFVFDKFLRTCDVCGTPRKASELTIRDNVAICIRHPGYRTAKELDRLNARQKVPIAPLRTTARPLSSLETWEAEEGQIFDLVTAVAPFEVFDTTSDGCPGIKNSAPGLTGNNSYTAAGWSCVYLYSVIAENKRPAAWLARAKAKLASLADYLLSVQTPAIAGDWTVGGFDLAVIGGPSQRFHAASAGVCCMALCRAYQVTGALKYLDAAKKAAGFIVVLQATDLAAFTVQPAYGPPAYYWDDTDGDYGMSYYPGDLVCYWAFSVLKAIAGDITITAPDPAAFTSDPSRKISTFMSRHRAFWTTGIANKGTTTLINGLSSATPYEFFDARAANTVWTLNAGNVTAANWALGLRSLYEVEGTSAQTSSCYAYLQGLADDPAFAAPTKISHKVLLQGALGDFDPSTAPPTLFSPAGKDASSFYDFASAGLLAPLATRASLDSTKAAIGIARRRTAEGSPRDGRRQYLGRLGMSGYSFQPYAPSVPNRQESVTRAAQCGLLYRIGMAGMGSH
jgi:hypothetical protein